MRSTIWLLLFALWSACAPEIRKTPATQIVVRVEASAAVLTVTRSLRLRVSSQEGKAWTLRSDQRYPLDDLQWPVDLVVVPRSESEAAKSFEVVADALGADEQVLVQARAITGFVRGQQRVLVLRVDVCGSRGLGFVCELDDACHGPRCQTCLADACASTPVIDPTDLPALDSRSVPTYDAGSRSSLDATANAGVDGAVEDAGGEAHDAAEPSCESGLRFDSQMGCVDVDECAEGLDDCDHAPQACINRSSMNGKAFECSCPPGYEGQGVGAEGCLDVNECEAKPAPCAALVMCNNTEAGYSCGNCPSGYQPGAGGECVDIDECETNNGGCNAAFFTCQNNEGQAPTCKDIDECVLNPARCGQGGTCTNVEQGGGYACTGCATGFSSSGGSTPTCVDQNECTANPTRCTNGGTCTNVAAGGGYTCTGCASGFTSSGGTFPTCVNINECSNASICTHGGSCTDGMPGYTCSCPEGSQTNGAQFAQCVDINECGGANVCSGTVSSVAFTYSCANADPYYTCRGQFAAWPLTDPSNRFVVSSGVVTDAKTGLKWQQMVPNPSDCQSVPACTLLVSICGTDGCTWNEAAQYCANLGGSLGTGWRLPTRIELLSIVDATRRDPAIDPTAFPGTPGVEFWTSSAYVGNSDGTWSVFFDDGSASSYLKTTGLNVRCVR